jgi:hypothetical protein
MQQVTLGQFVGYFQTAWGILAGISCFFPLSGSVFQIIHLPKQMRFQTSAISCISCCFVIFVQFVTVRNTDSLVAFVIGVPSFLAGLILLFASIFLTRNSIRKELARQWGGSYRDQGMDLVNTILQVIYVFSFALLTLAFTFVGSTDFWRNQMR